MRGGACRVVCALAVCLLLVFSLRFWLFDCVRWEGGREGGREGDFFGLWVL